MEALLVAPSAMTCSQADARLRPGPVARDHVSQHWGRLLTAADEALHSRGALASVAAPRDHLLQRPTVLSVRRAHLHPTVLSRPRSVGVARLPLQGVNCGLAADGALSQTPTATVPSRRRTFSSSFSGGGGRHADPAVRARPPVLLLVPRHRQVRDWVFDAAFLIWSVAGQEPSFVCHNLHRPFGDGVWTPARLRGFLR